MSIGILVGKIAALFIVMFLGFVLVKTGICRSDDSRILSRLSVYIVVPCSILSAFQVSCSPSILNGLLLKISGHGMTVDSSSSDRGDIGKFLQSIPLDMGG